MVASVVQVAKRALLATMRAVAFTVGMALTCSRDSPDREVVAIFRRLALRVHPDRPGGSTERQQRLNDARAAWDTARSAGKAAGRPKGKVCNPKPEVFQGAARKGRQWTGTSSFRFRCAATKVHAVLEMRVFLGSHHVNIFIT